MKRGVVLALALLLGLLPSAWAQVRSGNIYGTVVDESGAVLSGVNIALSGPTIGGRSTVSGSDGAFRFLTLDPGRYKLTVSLPGFATVERDVVVNVGVNVNLAFNLKVAAVAETITVNAETPVVDTRKVGTYSTFAKEELAQIPNGRDPWVVLRSVPGMLVDRINIAGNESGQQAGFAAKGTTGATWNLDGVEITDMAALGASPSYFDYDAFDEINITTGGSGGIGLNFVTKRGTNTFHGSIRGFGTHDKLQSSNLPAELTSDARLANKAADIAAGAPARRDKADHIQQIFDYGADLGGPLVKDKLWFWASYGKQDIRLQRLSGTRDRTVLKDYNAKLNWQASSRDMLSVFYFLGRKSKFGRGVGSGLQEDVGYTRNQTTFAPHKNFVPGFLKFEDNHVFSPNFQLNVKYAYYNWGFNLTPIAGRGCQDTRNFVTGIASGCSSYYESGRPSQQGTIDGNYFKAATGGNHEFKFGFGYRVYDVNSMTAYSGENKVQARIRPTGNRVRITRDALRGQRGQYWNGSLADVFTKDRLTLDVGVRFTRQMSKNTPVEAPANPLFPEILPALKFAGGGQGIDWKDFSPRVGINIALNESRKSVFRASFARYAGAMAATDASYDSPLGGVAIIEHNWKDLNSDGIVQKNEVVLNEAPTFSANVDPANPTLLTSPNRIDANVTAPHDYEAIAGIDHELFPNFAVGVAYTYRRSTDVLWVPACCSAPYIGVTANDYVLQPPVSAGGYTAQVYTIKPEIADAVTGGQIFRNRPGYNRTFNGLELTATKRLSNNWMMRAGFGYSNWVEHFDGTAGIQNPSHTDLDPQMDGGQVLLQGSGSGKTNYYSGKWQFNVSALYQLPSGFEIAGNLYGRQGFPRPIYLLLDGGALDGDLNVLAVPKVDTVRLPNLWNLDLRLAKNLKIAGSTSFALTADCFNVFNRNTELNRFLEADSTAFNRLDEIINPRIFRFGLRLQF
jgi:hypothetical protein